MLAGTARGLLNLVLGNKQPQADHTGARGSFNAASQSKQQTALLGEETSPRLTHALVAQKASDNVCSCGTCAHSREPLVVQKLSDNVCSFVTLQCCFQWTKLGKYNNQLD